MDEKAHNRKVKFHIISMKEPDEANGKDWKLHSIMKHGLTINRKKWEVTFRHLKTLSSQRIILSQLTNLTY